MTDMDLFRDAINLMHQQQTKEEAKLLSSIEKQWREVGEIQNKNLLIKLGFSSNEFFEKILARHPAAKLRSNVINVEQAFDILSQSRLSFVEIVGAFHSKIQHGLLSDTREKVLSGATREIYTYSCAASSLVQAYRHLISGDSDMEKKYEQLKANLLADAGLISFFSDLRTSNNHLHILTANPHYSIKSDFKTGQREVTSGLRFSRTTVVNSSVWKKTSQEFIASRENLDVVELLEQHYAVAEKFNRAVLSRLGVQGNKAYRDLLRISLARKSIGMQTSLGIILQVAIPKKLNPYEYLAQRFTKDELDNIYCFPDHSKEQVDYIISLRDPLGLCSKSMRKDLYTIFEVPT